MKPDLLKVPNLSSFSFSIREDQQPNINSRWHYHPEIELIHLHKGRGMQFVGDSVKRFEPGSIVLIGSNLPHYWRYDNDDPGVPASGQPYSTVVHFFENFWGDAFLNLPENKVIKKVLEKGKRGIELPARNNARVAGLMEKMAVAQGHSRIVLLMEILAEIDSSNDNLLSSIGFNHQFDDADHHRINLIYDYSFANYRNNFLLADVAQIANLTPNSFCRYFKLKTRKTYFQFINEIRVGQACKLLIEGDSNVKQICYACGFSNFSSFHTAFKLITGKTPLNYKQTYISGI
jgi:AraC-like DNA-binding protein